MNFQLDSVIEILLSPDNQRRTEAEQFIQDITAASPNEAIDSFLMTMNHENIQVQHRIFRWHPWQLYF